MDEVEGMTAMERVSAQLHEAALDSRQWLFEAALPLWSAVGRCPGGGFVDQVGHNGRALDLPKRCRVQARQIYVFSEAGRLGWDGPWRECLRDGLDFMLSRYRRPDGFMRFKVDRAGAVVDDLVDNYDQAFTIFALAAAYRWHPDPALLDVARIVAGALARDRANPAGGYHEGPVTPLLLANTHMHVFEAALAWIELGVEDPFRAIAEEIAGLCERAFVDPASGALREFFNTSWEPAPGGAGESVEPGHQCEWAWLLLRWNGLGGRTDPAVAHRLYAFAERHGLDRERHVIVNEVDVNGRLRDARARLWPQTERMKAALAFARIAETMSERDRLQAEAVDAWLGLSRYGAGTRPGLFFDKMNPDGSLVDEPAFASSMYHIMCALSELQAACAGRDAAS